MPELTTENVQRMFQTFSANQKTTAVWYTTLTRIKFVCRMNGLSLKQAGRLARKVAQGRMTVNQVMDHLSRVRRNEHGHKRTKTR